MKTLPSLFLLAALGVAGCTTMRVYDVQKDPTAPGVRYSLPKPVLVVSPSPEGLGAMDVDVKLVPDDAHTYAIDATSWLAYHKLQVDVQNRLLTKVVWNPDSTGVATEGIGAAAEIASAQVAAEQKRAEQDKADREAQVKAITERVQTLAKDVDTKREALEQAQAALRIVDVAGADPAAVRAAQVAVRNAEIAYQAALQRQQDPTQYFSSVLLTGAANEPLTNVQDTSAWGPVMLAINEKLEGEGEERHPVLTLKPATFLPQADYGGKVQVKFPTFVVTGPNTKTSASTPAGTVPQVTGGTPVLSMGNLQLTLQLNFEPIEMVQQSLKGSGANASAEVKNLSVVPQKTQKQLNVAATDVKPGEYLFVGRVQSAGGEVPVSWTFKAGTP